MTTAPHCLQDRFNAITSSSSWAKSWQTAQHCSKLIHSSGGAAREACGRSTRWLAMPAPASTAAPALPVPRAGLPQRCLQGSRQAGWHQEPAGHGKTLWCFCAAPSPTLSLFRLLHPTGILQQNLLGSCRRITYHRAPWGPIFSKNSCFTQDKCLFVTGNSLLKVFFTQTLSDHAPPWDNFQCLKGFWTHEQIVMAAKWGFTRAWECQNLCFKFLFLSPSPD